MRVSEPAPLLAGASRETWSLRAGGRDLVARADLEGAPRTGAMRREAQLMRVANAAGVPVPEVVAADDDLLVMAFVAGETTPRRILHDDDLSDARERLTRDCAKIGRASC